MNNPTQIQAAYNLVCTYFNVDGEYLKEQDRSGPYKIPRFMFFWLCRTYFKLGDRMTFEFIADFIKRNHATVLYGVRQIENWRETDPEIKRISTELFVLLEEFHGDYTFRADIAAGKYTDNVKSYFQDFNDALLLLEAHTLADSTSEGWRREKKKAIINGLKGKLKKIQTYPYLYEDSKKAMIKEQYEEAKA